MARRRGQRAEINIFGNAAFMDAMANTIGALIFMLLMVTVITVAVKLNRFPLQVVTKALPDAVVGKPYDVVLSGVGGNQPYQWEKVRSDLPDGLDIAFDDYREMEMQSGKVVKGNVAHVRGVPKAATALPARFLMRVTDAPMLDDKTGKRKSERMTATAEFQLTVHPGLYNVQPLRVLSSAIPSAVVGREYAVNLSATGGSPAYTWAVDPGLPEDVLKLNAADGKLSGVPARAGQWRVNLIVRDSTGASARTLQPIVFRVDPAPEPPPPPPPPPAAVKILSSQLPDAIVQRNYQATLAAGGGNGKYSWALSNAPDGLKLSSDGVLQWKPPLAGKEVTLAVSVASGSASDSKVLKLRIEYEPSRAPLKMF